MLVFFVWHSKNTNGLSFFKIALQGNQQVLWKRIALHHFKVKFQPWITLHLANATNSSLFLKIALNVFLLHDKFGLNPLKARKVING